MSICPVTDLLSGVIGGDVKVFVERKRGFPTSVLYQSGQIYRLFLGKCDGENDQWMEPWCRGAPE